MLSQPMPSARAAGRFAAHGAAPMTTLNLATSRPSRPPSSAWRANGPPMGTGGSPPCCPANRSRSTASVWRG